jgi:hypothetical protein
MFARTAAADVCVTTKDSAEYCGDLVEKVPGDHVTIKEATGEVKRFAWSDVTGETSHEAPAAPAPAPGASTKEETDKPPQVHIVVDGEPGVLLERRQNASEGWSATIWPGYSYVETWEVACVAPCKTVVDAASTYRVNGTGVATSRNFVLPPGRDPLRLHLVPRSAVLHATGIVLSFVGGLLALAGGASLASSPAISDAAAAANVRGLGWVGLGAGALMMVIGIPTWIATYSYAQTE